jgi:hypothetical protein
MAFRRVRSSRRSVALAVLTLCAFSSACSSSSPSGRSSPGASSGPAGSTKPGAASTGTSSAPAVDPVQTYLDRVNSLCDNLLPKVLAAIHGGHPDVYPVAEFMSELPKHAQLETDFDAALAKIPVPPAAQTQSAALHAYITYANTIDRKRLAAARRGQADFDKEIRAENAEAPNDPVIAARTAAGFNESCNAR